ncbi:efflux RND transporter periplasmic adaptor subunit [Desulfogranum mediterraneum]|uniref:efflux RND transporter periplasmic adaptor subunit n=1 Tax=Desulfogranum mediterraneum TaxID=160661 RepID=UPI0004206A6B|nr:efflux RND transporter periplasmic adaptor subunit [Desulfogranum mediterraneum]
MKRFLKQHLKKIAFTLLLVAGLGGYYTLRSAEEPAQFLTAAVVDQDIEKTVSSIGTLQGATEVDVGAQVSGQLTSLKVRLGQQVKAGELLASIDPVLQENDLRDALAEQQVAAAQIKVREAQLKLYLQAFKRQEQMLSADASSRAELEAAEAQLTIGRAELLASREQLKKATIRVDKSRANLGYTRILAPMDGVVTSIVTKEGQTVVSAQQAPTILKLTNLDTMTVKAKISEADVVHVKAGMEVYFTILGDPETRYVARLRAIEPAPSSSGESAGSAEGAIYYNGLFEVANPEHTLRVGMTAQVSIIQARVKAALAIPLSALGTALGRNRFEVRVLADELPQSREIVTGIDDGVQVQVVSGLEVGEQLILKDGGQATAEGLEVEFY